MGFHVLEVVVIHQGQVGLGVSTITRFFLTQLDAFHSKDMLTTLR